MKLLSFSKLYVSRSYFKSTSTSTTLVALVRSSTSVVSTISSTVLCSIIKIVQKLIYNFLEMITERFVTLM